MGIVSEITLKHELSRNTTRQEYKEINHWLRDCRRIINAEIDRQYYEMFV
jgi:hypothetical protein